jgi:hypothetical protein
MRRIYRILDCESHYHEQPDVLSCPSLLILSHAFANHRQVPWSIDHLTVLDAGIAAIASKLTHRRTPWAERGKLLCVLRFIAANESVPICVSSAAKMAAAGVRRGVVSTFQLHSQCAMRRKTAISG